MEKNNSLLSFTLAFISVVLAFTIFSQAQSFFTPLILAIVISFLIISFAEGFAKLSYKKHRLPRSVCYLLSIGGLLYIIWGIASLLTSQVNLLITSFPVYKQRMERVIADGFSFFSIPIPNFAQYLEQFDITDFLSQILLFLTDFAGYGGMVFIYILFILLEVHYIFPKVDALLPEKEQSRKAREMLKKIVSQIQTYLTLKTLLSVLTATCSYIVLTIIGVDFALFWTFLIFILNFIPTIGSIIATVFPCLFTLLQFETFTPFIIVTALLIATQFLIGNVLEPRIMGKKFNLSGLVIVLSLAIWGRVWGILGMFLCVPILVIAIIVLSHFSKTRKIAILLSQDGQV